VVQILDAPGSRFQQFFDAFKPGLESGIDTYAKKRLLEKESKKKTAAIEALGLPAEYANLDPALQKEVYKQHTQNQFLESLGLGSSNSGMSGAKGSNTGNATNRLLGNEPQGNTNEEFSTEDVQKALPLYKRLGKDQRAALSVKYPSLANTLEKQSQFEEKQNLAEKKFTREGEQFEKTYGLSKEKAEFEKEKFGKTQTLAEEKAELEKDKFNLQKDEALKKAQKDKNQTEYDRLKDLWNYKPNEDYLKEVREKAEDAETNTMKLNEFEKLTRSGEISPSNLRNLGASLFGNKLPFLFSAPGAAARSLEKQLATAGFRTNFGARPAASEFFYNLGASAQFGKTNEANLAVIDLQKKWAALDMLDEKFAQEVIKDNGGAPPRDLPSKVRDKKVEYLQSLNEEAKNIMMKFGSPEEKKQAQLIDKATSAGLDLNDYELMVAPDGEPELIFLEDIPSLPKGYKKAYDFSNESSSS
jgi:hypothetical protein